MHLLSMWQCYLILGITTYEHSHVQIDSICDTKGVQYGKFSEYNWHTYCILGIYGDNGVLDPVYKNHQASGPMQSHVQYHQSSG